MMTLLLKPITLLQLSLFLVACGGGEANESPQVPDPIIPTPTEKLESIYLTLDSTTLLQGEATKYKAEGYYSTLEGSFSRDITDDVTIDPNSVDSTLISIDESLAEITASNTTTGESTLTVTKEEITSNSVPISVVKLPPERTDLKIIAILPGNTVLGQNAISTNTAYGFTSDIVYMATDNLTKDLHRGENISDQVVWRSSDPSIFTVDPHGNVTTSGHNVGTAQLTATNGSLTATVGVTVTKETIPTLTKLEVSMVNAMPQSNGFLMLEDTLWQARALATFDNGDIVDVTKDANTRWESNRLAMLNVDNNVDSLFKGVFYVVSAFYTSNSFDVFYRHNDVSKSVTKTTYHSGPQLKNIEIRSNECDLTELTDMPQGPTFFCHVTTTPGDILNVNIWGIFDDGSQVDISATHSVFSHKQSKYYSAIAANTIMQFPGQNVSGSTLDTDDIAYIDPIAVGDPLKIKINENAEQGQSHQFDIVYLHRYSRGQNYGFASIVIDVQ